MEVIPMAENYEPIQKVRKELQVKWYRCPIEPPRLRELTRRSDLQGAFQTLGFIALTVATGLAVFYTFSVRAWFWFAISLFAHGTVYNFYAGVAVHELSHGTVFKTKWLNELFNRFSSLISWHNPYDYKMSHTYHHIYTLHPEGDREVVLPTNPTLHFLFLLQLFTVIFFGARAEPYAYPMVPNIGGTLRLAFTGRHSKEWLRAVFADQEPMRRKTVRWAWILILFHTALIVVAIVFKIWMLPVVITFAPFMANWLRYFVAVPMHTGLRDNVTDFRLCVRTITLFPLISFIYWRMNWHTEHHMYAAVPCYNLKKMHKTVAFDMPEPRTLFGAWREIRQIRRKQKDDPSYQFDTPLPEQKREERTQDALEASIGDLDPRSMG